MPGILKFEIEMLRMHINKKEIESSIENIEEDQNLLLYYSLLDFGYKYLIDNLSVAKNSFDQIESFNKPTDDFLSYYYHFIKQSTLMQLVTTMQPKSIMK